MKPDYQLRQEQKRQIENLSDDKIINISIYIKGETIFKYNKIDKVHIVFKEI